MKLTNILLRSRCNAAITTQHTIKRILIVVLNQPFFLLKAVATDSFYNGGFMCGRLTSAVVAGFLIPR